MAKDKIVMTTADKINAALLELNPEYRIVLTEDEPELITVYPPKSYTQDYEIDVWLYEDEIELHCGGYDNRFLDKDASAETIAEAVEAFIEENESWAND
jgi:hypothetical protein